MFFAIHWRRQLEKFIEIVETLGAVAGPAAPRTPAALSNRRIDLEGATTTRAGSDSSQAEAVTAALEDIERLHTVTIATADTPEPTRRASQ